MLLKYLRDPFWQAIGVLVAVVAIFISTNTSSTSSGELTVVHYMKVKFSEFWLPSNQIKLLVQGSKQELDKAVVDYILITNTSSKPILPSDYISPLELTKGKNTNRIITVESCSKPLAKANSTDGSSTPSGSTYVAFKWTNKNDKWIATPTLLNPGDESCVIVISDELTPPLANADGRIEWDARIANVQLKTYKSAEDFAAKTAKSWSGYFWTAVILQGWGVYWFVLLQSIIFGVTTILGIQSRWISTLSLPNVLRILFAMLLSTSTAEILVDIFVNQRGENLHPIVWPLLALHILFLCYLSYRALLQRSTNAP